MWSVPTYVREVGKVIKECELVLWGRFENAYLNMFFKSSSDRKNSYVPDSVKSPCTSAVQMKATTTVINILLLLLCLPSDNV